MAIEIREGQARRRCDVCKRLIPAKKLPYPVMDTVKGVRLDSCGTGCADRYFIDNYQVRLAYGCPSSNTGVVLPEKGVCEGCLTPMDCNNNGCVWAGTQ